MNRKIATMNKKASNPKKRDLGQARTKNVLFLGFGFSLQRLTSDKNFWNSLVYQLAQDLDEVVVVSINASPQPCQKNGNIYVYNIPSFFSWRRKANHFQNPYLYCHSWWWGILDKSLTVLKLIPLLAKLRRRHNLGVLHLMDSFGLMNRALKLAFPGLRLGMSLLTYNVHGWSDQTYHTYQKLALAKLDYVVTTSRTSQERLAERRIKTSGVNCIKCGVDRRLLKIEKVPEGEGINFKGHLKNCLWTGFIQQIGQESFWFTLSLAQKLTALDPDIRFTFAFKPECLKEEYLISSPRITVLSTTPEQFRGILSQTSLLVSPIRNYRSVCAPPLSWLECLGQGIPVVSTAASGVEEILTFNQAGLVGRTEQELIQQILLLQNDRKTYQKLSENAQTLVQREYLIEETAAQYLKLWEKENGLPG